MGGAKAGPTTLWPPSMPTTVSRCGLPAEECLYLCLCLCLLPVLVPTGGCQRGEEGGASLPRAPQQVRVSAAS